MTGSSAKAAKNKALVSPAKIVASFDDTRRIADLFGEFDEHLAIVERGLSVEITARGNQVVIQGMEEDCEKANNVLASLYDRLEQGEEIVSSDVDGAVRMVNAPSASSEDGSNSKKRKLIPTNIATRRRKISARTRGQENYLRALDKNDLILATGPAGTGKTFLAVAYAAAQLEKGTVARIILSRPAVEAGERLGFLPGDLRDKVDPYLRPLYDGLFEMMGPDKVEKGLASEAIEIAPLAFMRGRTLSNAIVILDEAQNATSMQMKMFLTRLGEGTKMIVTGDPSQVDLPPGFTSGLAEALSLLKSVEGVAQVHFTDQDVVRHPLVARIVRAYDKLYSDGNSKK